MNRAPSDKEAWFVEHQMVCNGTFKKITEPFMPMESNDMHYYNYGSVLNAVRLSSSQLYQLAKNILNPIKNFFKKLPISSAFNEDEDEFDDELDDDFEDELDDNFEDRFDHDLDDEFDYDDYDEDYDNN